MINVKVDCNFSRLENRLQRMKGAVNMSLLDKYGKRGVEALKEATPKDTGLAASSWYYKIEQRTNSVKLIWCNSDIEDEVPVAIILQYGHPTKNGTFVEGIDYINPAMKPVFKKLLKEIDGEVRSR